MKFTFKLGTELTLGIVVPVILLAFATTYSIQSSTNLNNNFSIDSLNKTFTDFTKDNRTSNDYALFSLMFLETTNYQTMVNKQKMKVSVVLIGFSLISIGFALIILGVNDGGAEGEASLPDGNMKISFKTASTGLAIIICGSIASTIGGVLPNEYYNNEIPRFNAPNNSYLTFNRPMTICLQHLQSLPQDATTNFGFELASCLVSKGIENGQLTQGN